MLKPRQPQKQQRTPKREARLAPPPTLRSSSGGGIGGAAARTATFAQSIAGKYGFRIGDPFGRLALVFLQAGGTALQPKRSAAADHRDFVVRLQLQLEALRHPEAPQLPSLQRTLVQLVPVWMRHNAAGQASGSRVDSGGKNQAAGPDAVRRKRENEQERDSHSAPKAAAAAVWHTRRSSPSANDAYEHAKRPVWKTSKAEEPVATSERRPMARRIESSRAARMRQTIDTVYPNGVPLQHPAQQFFDIETKPTTTQINAAARSSRRPASTERQTVEPDTSFVVAPEQVSPERRPAIRAHRAIPASAVRTAARKLLPVPPSEQPMLSHVRRQRQDRGAPSPWRWERTPGSGGEAAVRPTALQRIVLQRKHMEVLERSHERQLWMPEVRREEMLSRRMAPLPAAGLQRMQMSQADDGSGAKASRFASGAAVGAAAAAAAVRSDEHTVRTLAAWLTHLNAARPGRGESSRLSAGSRSFAAPAAPGDEAGSRRDSPGLQRQPAVRAALARVAESSSGEGASSSPGAPAAPLAAVHRITVPGGERETGRSGSREASFVPRLVAQAVRDGFGMRGPGETAAQIALLQPPRSHSELERFTAWAQQRARRREEGAAAAPGAGSLPDAGRIVRRRPLSGTFDRQPPSMTGARRAAASPMAGEQGGEAGILPAAAAYVQPRRPAPFAPPQAASHPRLAGDGSRSLAGGDEAVGHERQLGRVRVRPAAIAPHKTQLAAKRSGGKRPFAQDGEWPPVEAGVVRARFRPVPAAMAETKGEPADAAATQAARRRPASIVQLARWVPGASQPGAPRLSVLPHTTGIRSVSAPAAAAVQLASVAAPIGTMATVLRAARDHRQAPPERRTAFSQPSAAAPAPSGSGLSPGTPAARASVRSAASLAANTKQAENAFTASTSEQTQAAIVRTVSPSAQRAPAIIARKAAPGRSVPQAMTGMAPPAAPLAPSAIARTVSLARIEPPATIRRPALPSARSVRPAAPSARPEPAIIARKAAPARSVPQAMTGMVPPAALLAPSATARTVPLARTDSAATIRRLAAPSARLATSEGESGVSDAARNDSLATVRPAPLTARSAPPAIARRGPPAQPAIPADAGLASLVPSAVWRTAVPGAGMSASANTPAPVRRKPASANDRTDGAEAPAGRSALPGDEIVASAIVRRRLEHTGAASPATWQERRSLSRLHEAALMLPRAMRAERSALAGSDAAAAPVAADRLQRRSAEPAAAAAPGRAEADSPAAASRIVRRAQPAAARAEPAAERLAPAPQPSLRQTRPAAARTSAARAASAANAPAAAHIPPPSSGIARTPGDGSEARVIVRRQAEGSASGISHRISSPRAGERAASAAGDVRSLPAAARAGTAIVQRAAAPANVIQLMVGMLERKTRERSEMTTTAGRRLARQNASPAAADTTAARTVAAHHFTFEHKLVSAGSVNSEQQTQIWAGNSGEANLPLALDWLQRRPAVIQAASPEPEPERTEPQIDIAQLQEIIQKLPQFDVRKLADRVYRELEKRLRFDRQTRGL